MNNKFKIKVYIILLNIGIDDIKYLNNILNQQHKEFNFAIVDIIKIQINYN